MTTTQALLASLLKNKASINQASSQDKNQALQAMADQLLAEKDHILQANQKDMAQAEGKIGQVMQDRLLLTESRIQDMAQGILDLIDLPDPAGRILDQYEATNGLVINKLAEPFGLIAIIYESRPNVTSDAAALALKSGNATILRSGKEAFQTSQAIVTALKHGLATSPIPDTVLELVQDTSRASSIELMTAKGQVDLLIPRGGAGLIQAVVDQATVPVIETGTGLCHIYVDASAKLDMALNIVENAKCDRPSVCNAAEALLVHQDQAPSFLPRLEDRLGGRVELLADDQAASYLQQFTPGTEEDFHTEHLDYKLSVKVVPSLEEAIDHINSHSTGHSEAIITEDDQAKAAFTRQVDSAALYVNASTRFTDGSQFGLGCELGISTQKMHARGPMGLNEMTTYKYVIEGNGQIRQ